MHMNKTFLAATFLVFLATGIIADDIITEKKTGEELGAEIIDAKKHDFGITFVQATKENDNYVYVFKINTAKDITTGNLENTKKQIQITLPAKEEVIDLEIIKGKATDYLLAEQQAIKEKIEEQQKQEKEIPQITEQDITEIKQKYEKEINPPEITPEIQLEVTP